MTVDIIQSGGVEVLTERWSLQDRRFGKMSNARIRVPRDEAKNANLRPLHDEVILNYNSTDQFSGVLRKAKRSGQDWWELIVDSYERYGLQAEPSAAGVIDVNTNDGTFIGGSVDAIPQLSKGNIQNTTSVAQFPYNYEPHARLIRRMADLAGGELRYNQDKSVDYLAPGTRGSDKTDTVIGPSNSNLEQPDIDEDSGQEEVTHLVVVGAGRGKKQMSAVVKPSDDSTDYLGKDAFNYNAQGTYSNPNWSSGDEKYWDTVKLRNLRDPEVLLDQGLNIIDERTETHQKIVLIADAIGEVTLGDEFTIDYPEEGFNSVALRAQRVRKVHSGRQGVKYRVTFKNRRVADVRASDKKNRSILDYEVSELPDDGVVEVESDYTTDVGPSRKQAVLVDTSAGAHTITLAETDLVEGVDIRVVDATGDANTNNISLTGGGSTSIVGPSASTISTNHGYRVYTARSNQNEWREVASN